LAISDALRPSAISLGLLVAVGLGGCAQKKRSAEPFRPVGAFVFGPSATAHRDGRIDLFVVGSSKTVWRSACSEPPCDSGKRYEDWLVDVGAPPPGAGSRVAVTAWGDRRQDFFIVGARDRRMWHQTREGTRWLGWEDMSGSLFATPAATSWGEGRIDVFAVGPGETIYQRYCLGTGPLACRASSFTLWSPYPGRPPAGVVGDPAAAAATMNQIDIAVLGRDGAIWYVGYLNGWGGWQSLGGQFAHAPAIAIVGYRTEIYALDANKKLWRASGSNRVFEPFTQLEVSFDEPPAAAGSPTGAELFARTPGGETLLHVSCATGDGGCMER